MAVPPGPPTPPPVDQQGSSTRPYLIRALHDWCTDNGFTPYVAVYVDANVQVPMEYVKNHEIVLNVGFDATSGMRLGNDVIEFKARFGGVARDIIVPVDHVIAIYARENGQGMAFPVPTEATPTVAPAEPGAALLPTPGLRLAPAPDAPDQSGAPDPEPPVGGPSGAGSGGAGRPSLKRIK